MNLRSFHRRAWLLYPSSVRYSCIFYAIQPNISLAERAGVDHVFGEIWTHNSGTDVWAMHSEDSDTNTKNEKEHEK